MAGPLAAGKHAEGPHQAHAVLRCVIISRISQRNNINRNAVCTKCNALESSRNHLSSICGKTSLELKRFRAAALEDK